MTKENNAIAGGVDLLAIAPETTTVSIKHPKTGAIIGLTVDLLPLTDIKVKTTIRGIRETEKKLARRGKTFNTLETEQNNITIIISAIAGWRWDDGANLGGEQLPFNEKNARKLLEIDWLNTQLDLELGDTSQFFR